MANDVEHLFTFLGHLCIFFRELFSQILCPFLNGAVVTALSALETQGARSLSVGLE